MEEVYRFWLCTDNGAEIVYKDFDHYPTRSEMIKVSKDWPEENALYKIDKYYKKKAAKDVHKV
jgi:hypothetical protein